MMTQRSRRPAEDAAIRGTSRGTAHMRNRCNNGHYRYWTVASVQVVRARHWAGLLLTHWFRVRPPGAPPLRQPGHGTRGNGRLARDSDVVGLLAGDRDAGAGARTRCPPFRHATGQVKRRGCLVHVVLTAWLRHPHRMCGTRVRNTSHDSVLGAQEHQQLGLGHAHPLSKINFSERLGDATKSLHTVPAPSAADHHTQLSDDG